MRKLIEYCLVSADGVVEDPVSMGFGDYHDDAYLRDGLGLFEACDAILFGRSTYERFAKMWTGREGTHPLCRAAQFGPKVRFLLDADDS